MTIPIAPAAPLAAVPGVPGLRFTARRPGTEPSPLRSDIAGFIGRTRRGRVHGERGREEHPTEEYIARDGLGVAVRVVGWRGYLREFGGLDDTADTPYALRGYFANGGDVAWVVRVCAYDAPANQLTAGTGTWVVGAVTATGEWAPDAPAAAGFVASRYRIEATTPGEWANGTVVVIRYWLRGPDGKPTVDFAVQAPDEPPEYLRGLSPSALHVEGALPSALVRVVPDAPKPAPPLLNTDGPTALEWRVTLGNGAAPAPRLIDYVRAAEVLCDVADVAIVAAPDLTRDFPANPANPGASNPQRLEVVATLLEHAAMLNDRLVLIDVASPDESVSGIARRLADLERSETDRTAAVYHPWLRVPESLEPAGSLLRTVPPSGHVAGVISRLDRERGAQHTPANAELLDAVDVSRAFDLHEQEVLFLGGVNLLRCAPGRGLLVWGGRTLGMERTVGGSIARAGRFVAHRRLIHRLVRAIRRVAEPLVFDVNGPALWLTLVRAITTVLLEAWRGGGLKGARADEAFVVKCDEETNPPEERDLGRVLCRIGVAPAVPMEFIELRVALSAEGRLEVFET
jgi:Bacteriophage tail sheath protein